jgi:opacity protein-like surface antigen
MGGGATIPEDGRITQFTGLSSGQRVQYDAGGGLDLAGGYAFNKYFATELQLGGTWNSIDSIEGASVHDTYFATMPILANAVLRFPIPRTVVVPYIGAGVGGAATLFDTDGFSRSTGGGGGGGGGGYGEGGGGGGGGGGTVTLYGSESDFVFAWQGFAGVRFEINERMSFALTYRYLSVDPSAYHYPAVGGPDVTVGFSGHQSHFVGVCFSMKL